MPAGSDSPGVRLTREERRRRTEAAILDAGRELFAELGFERTTIRGVAARAGVDPALKDLFRTFEDPQTRDGAVALIRNCLTHDTARDIVREEVICQTQASVAKTIGGPDAELRAALIGSSVVGLIVSRYLLQVPALADASREDLERVLGPALAQLVGPG